MHAHVLYMCTCALVVHVVQVHVLFTYTVQYMYSEVFCRCIQWWHWNWSHGTNKTVPKCGKTCKMSLCLMSRATVVYMYMYMYGQRFLNIVKLPLQFITIYYTCTCMCTLYVLVVCFVCFAQNLDEIQAVFYAVCTVCFHAILTCTCTCTCTQ